MTTPSDNDLSAIVALLEVACRQSTHLAVDRALRPELPPLVPDPVISEDGDRPPSWTIYQRAAGWAFGYRVTESRDNGRPRVTVEPFFAMSDGEQSPPPVESVAEEIVDAWEAMADLVTAPYAQARLQHLLFVRRRGNGRDRARAAIQGYIHAAARWTRDSDRAHDLTIALRLARAVQATDLAQIVTAEVVRRAKLALDQEDRVPGRFLHYIEQIIDEPATPAEIDDLLSRAAALYEDPWILDRLHALRRARARDPQERAAIEAAAVQVWLDAADAQSGLLRATHLKKALERATASGRPDLIERAAAALQSVSSAKLGLMSISASATLSDEEAEELIAPITERSDWKESLLAFVVVYGPATGDVIRNREQAAEQAAQFVLATLLPKELIGSDGLPRFKPHTDEARAEMALAEQESYQLQTWSRLLAHALVGVARKHGTPSEDEVAEFFATRPRIDGQLAAALARVLVRFWTGDYEGAAFTAAPRVETLARGLVIAVDAGVYRLQRENWPGQYPGLGSLLGILREHGLDESWYRMVHTVCSNPAGWNIRNEMGHGFVDNVQAPVAAVLIQALLYLSLLSPGESDTGGSTETGGETG